ncbi:MAG: IS5 family transposase [Bacteroidota bacterium]
MLVTDGEGLPIGLLVESAQKSEVRLAEETLATVRVARARGRARTRPDRLTCDRGYDSRAFRRYLTRRGIRHAIPTRRRPKRWKARRGRPPECDASAYRQRWKVERTFAWLFNYRRVVVRWERHVGVYRGFVLFALSLLCLNRLLQ